ncbi:MAG: tripartite tricarboxylate transporter substrate binding protein [Burkholderiales bacterium]|nr:tripartite tricarboxylate transporter substrate binding protein [Burkholderiales bacterium]
MNRPIRLIVPFAAGGPADTIARVFTDKAGTALGQTFVIDNRLGAGSTIGTAVVARSAPDGHTLLLATSATTNVATLYTNLTYNTMRDLRGIAALAFTPYFLTVPTSLPVNSVQELIAYSRKNPGAVFYGSSGVGSTPHLAGELFKMTADIPITHVPYKGSALAMTDLIGGRIQLLFTGLSVSRPHIEGGRLKVLGVASLKRSEFLPAVPTIAEQGLPNFQAESWFGIMGPAGMPSKIEAEYGKVFGQIVAEQMIRDRLLSLGAVPASLSPEEYRKFLQVDLDRWAKVIRAAGIKI